jgi:HPt (histidine-containing phosphotransfer) domain-containing protein
MDMELNDQAIIPQSVDPKAIARILLIADRDFVVEMIDTFLDDAEKFMVQMQTALDGGDPDVLHHATHSLKSPSTALPVCGAIPVPPSRTAVSVSAPNSPANSIS